MPAALDLYRRLGFVVDAPSYPAVVRDGGSLEPFGAANTHADFSRDFLELATVVGTGRAGGRLPPDARLVPLQAPPGALPSLVERISATSAILSDCLARYEGLHILMFSSSDIEATAARLAAAGVGHGGINTVRRPAGPGVETVRYLEIDGARPGARAGGRIGVVADLDPAIQGFRALDHPNGAVGLVDASLCVADAESDAVRERYEAYLGRTPAVEEHGCVFDLGAATLTLVPASGLSEVLPGHQPPALPAVVSCTVAVRDRAATEELLRAHEVPVHRSGLGDLVVPATAALGAAIAFR